MTILGWIFFLALVVVVGIVWNSGAVDKAKAQAALSISFDKAKAAATDLEKKAEKEIDTLRHKDGK